MVRDEFMARSFDVLLRMLAVQVEGYGRLLEHLTRKREAIRTADLATVVDVCNDERAVLDRLADVEQSRLRLVDELTRRVRGADADHLRVEEIADLADATRAAKLRSLAKELKSRVVAARDESAVVNKAARALSSHMAGIMQTVQTTLGGAGVYGRRGAVAAPRQDLCVDVRR